MELLIATGNAGKAREFAELLPPGWRVRTLADFPGVAPAAEDGATFRENAVKKALHLAARHPGWVLADDSGLEVDALGGEPGVYSARYAGEGAGDAANLSRLLEKMRGVPEDARGARFRCALALACGGRVRETFDGVCEGRIIGAPRGRGGFGYDPVFVPAGGSRTFAEMAPVEKHALSHRGRAFQRAAGYLLGLRSRGEAGTLAG